MANYEEVAHPDFAYGGSYFKVTANQNNTGSQFASQIKFAVPQNSNEFHYVPKNCYMSIKFQIAQTDELGAVHNLGYPILNAGARGTANGEVISIPYIQNNAIGGLFDNITTDINSLAPICDNQFVAPASTLYRILYELSY